MPMWGRRPKLLLQSTTPTPPQTHPPKPCQQAGHIYRTALTTFGPRLFATCFGWVANDFAFYGNKLFQSSFIAALYPQVSLVYL
jgi:hypothetical protein